MKRRILLPVSALAAGVMVLAGCSAGNTGDSVAQDESSPITVWVDDTRTKPAEDYAAANPDLNATIEPVDNTQGAIASRIALATKAGDPLPDVVFLSNPDEIASLVANPVNFPLALNDKVGDGVLDGFAPASISACTFGGQAYCLPNDIAQTVVYYNKPLFEQFGYTVPTTFEEWSELGTTVARDHPGYSLGSVSSRYGIGAYYGSSECPLTQSDDPTSVRLDPSAQECTRVNDVVGPMLANGSMSTLDPFDPTYTKVLTDNKLLATISPSWMGEYGIKPNSATNGTWAVAPMPTWNGATDNTSAAVGGGIWIVSAKSKNQKAAIEFATNMSSDVNIQQAAPTYPANIAAADKWLERASQDQWYAEDPSSILRDAASKMTSTQGFVRYYTQMLDNFTSTVIADSGKDIENAWTTFGDQTRQAAEAAGYTVK